MFRMKRPTVKQLYIFVLLAFLTTFVASIIHSLSQPYTKEPYYLQEGE